MFTRILLLLVTCMGLSACLGFSQPVKESSLPDVREPRAEGDNADSAPTQIAKADATGPVVLRLSKTARQLQKQGRSSQAAATLERALRIAPRNAKLWQQLAQVRLEQGKWHLAESMAAKSNSFAGKDRELQAENWKLIASANRAQGRPEAAQRAWSNYRALQQK